MAFDELHTCRPAGMGLASIPWTATDRYADANGFQGEQRDDLHHHIREMDGAYLRYQDGKKPAPSARSKK